MKNYIWNLVNERAWNRKGKERAFLICSVFFYAMIGLISWAIVGRLFFEQIEWFVCFVGYPGFFLGFVGGIMYLFRKY